MDQPTRGHVQIHDGIRTLRENNTWYEIPKHLNHCQTMGYLREFAHVWIPGLTCWSKEIEKWEQEGKEYYQARRRDLLLETEMPKDLVLLIETFIQ